MPYDPDRHHRRSIRLRGYDYSQAGAYFVTICTQGRECLFGRVADGAMRLNDAGRMVERWWAELGSKYPTVIPDVYVVMPNHFHGIIIMNPATHDGAGAHGGQGAHAGAPLQSSAGAGAHVGADLRVCPDPGAHGDPGAAGTKGAHAGAPLQSSAGAGADVGADRRVCPDPGAHTGAPLQSSAGAGADVGADRRVCPDPGAHGGPGAAGTKGAHAGAPLRQPTDPGAHGGQGAHAGAPLRQPPGAAVDIPKIVQWFKTMTTNAYIRGVKTLGWTPFPGRLWQRNYYEHIIRDDESLNRIRRYIVDNPAHWAEDDENPEKEKERR